MGTEKKITLKTADGVHLAGLHRVAGAKTPRATLILVHGFTAHTQQPDFSQLLDMLDRPRINQIAYDTRGHGKSGGEASFGNWEYLDVKSAVELACENNAPILLAGISAGAASIAHYLHKGSYPSQIAGYMLISSPGHWQGRIGLPSFYMFYLTKTKGGRKKLRERHGVKLALPVELPIAPVDAIADIKLPVAVVGGTGDKLLGGKASRQLYEQANLPKRLELAPGARHGPSASLGQAASRGLDWLLTQLEIDRAQKQTN